MVGSLVIGGGVDGWTGSLDLRNNLLVVQAADTSSKATMLAMLFDAVNSTASQESGHEHGVEHGAGGGGQRGI